MWSTADGKNNGQTNPTVKGLFETLNILQLVTKFFVGKKLEGSSLCS
jgi:hypothetical protein